VRAASYASRIAGLLIPVGACHEGADGVGGGAAFVEGAAQFFQDGSLDPETLRQAAGGGGGRDALRGLVEIPQGAFQRLPAGEGKPEAVIAAEGAVGGGDRSPSPARPLNVAARAPAATPRRVISARPRVSRPALVLFPKPRPSLIPAATAIGFFSAPPNSTPATSELV
jgi:hypothetical protein